MNYHKKKRRIQKKALGRAKKTEKQLLRAMRANRDARGNLYAVPSVKRAMKKHSEALREDDSKRASHKRRTTSETKVTLEICSRRKIDELSSRSTSSTRGWDTTPFRRSWVRCRSSTW